MYTCNDVAADHVLVVKGLEVPRKYNFMSSYVIIKRSFLI